MIYKGVPNDFPCRVALSMLCTLDVARSSESVKSTSKLQFAYIIGYLQLIQILSEYKDEVHKPYTKYISVRAYFSKLLVVLIINYTL